MGFYRKEPKSKTKPCKKQIVTINVPNQYIDCLDEMIELGLINSRSEFVREALTDFFENEKNLRNDIEVNFTELITVVRKGMAIA